MRVEVLGSLRVVSERGGLTARDFRGAKPKQILEILVVERGHTVSKERMADLLWGEDTPRTHMATLETYVSVLRQTLQPGTAPRESVVLTERGGYRLDLDRVVVDLDDFDEAVAKAAGAEPHDALDTIKRGLSLVRGPVLEDEPYADWAQATRETYQQRQVQALIDGGRLSLLTGDAVGALAMAEQAVGLNPLAEPAYQLLMTAAYALWRQDEALAAFQRCRRLLADELGVDPLDETVALHLSILRHEDIAQLLPSPVAPTGTDALTDRLPLLGRDVELQQLRTAAARAATGRLMVALVTGAPGVGKSRLLEALGEQLDLPQASNRCSDLERGFPFLALSLALRRALPELAERGLPGVADLLDRAERGQTIDEYARLRVMESLADALATRPPFLLLLDDVQWADPETLITLGYLQRRCPEAAILAVLTCDPATAATAPLRTVRPDLRIDLMELQEAQLAALAGPELYEQAGGNPSHVASWLEARARGLSEPFTPELRERVITSCWDLGPQAFRLLTTAAVLGPQPFSVDLLAHVLMASPVDVAEELDRLFERALLGVVGDAFVFRSPAMRSILGSTLSPARRGLLQRTAASFGSAAPRRRVTDLTEAPPLGAVRQRRQTDVGGRPPSAHR